MSSIMSRARYEAMLEGKSSPLSDLKITINAPALVGSYITGIGGAYVSFGPLSAPLRWKPTASGVAGPAPIPKPPKGGDDE